MSVTCEGMGNRCNTRVGRGVSASAVRGAEERGGARALVLLSLRSFGGVQHRRRACARAASRRVSPCRVAPPAPLLLGSGRVHPPRASALHHALDRSLAHPSSRFLRAARGSLPRTPSPPPLTPAWRVRPCWQPRALGRSVGSLVGLFVQAVGRWGGALPAIARARFASLRSLRRRPLAPRPPLAPPARAPPPALSAQSPRPPAAPC